MSGTEFALRAAVHAVSNDVSSTDGKADAIRKAAEQRLQSQNNISSPSILSSANIEAAAIGAAVAVIAVAYDAIKTQLHLVKERRVAFSKELGASVASYIILRTKEPKDVSDETKAIGEFLSIKDKYPSIANYFGIQTADLSKHDIEGDYFSVLPFFKMSEKLGQPLSSMKPIDRQRMFISQFFKTSGSAPFAAIARSFNSDYFTTMSSWYHGDNYLNDRRAPRFTVMCLLNVLWHLQHPVDKDGFPLGPQECIELCRTVSLFVTDLLASGFFSYLIKESNDKYGLLSLLRRFAKQILALEEAYIDEHTNELNIDDITTSAHRTLRIMDTSTLKLIFKRHNSESRKDEPDDTAADCIADAIWYMNLLLRLHPDILQAIQIPDWIDKKAGINNQPTTVIDLLIILCHLSTGERDALLAKIEQCAIESALELARELKNFHERFIRPIRRLTKTELNASSFSSREKKQDVSSLTARRLMPLLTLVIEDYRTDVDSPFSYLRAKNSEDDPSKKIYSGKQQVQDINASAYQGGGYYTWTISPFVGGATELDGMVKYQYRLTRMTKLLDSVSEIVKNYRSYLTQQPFIDFLMRCLGKIKLENAELAKRIKDADALLANNERISHGLQAILRPLTSELARSLQQYNAAAATFENVVADPSFTDQQKELLSSKLCGISSQFTELFGESSGLSELINGIESSTSTTTAIAKESAKTTATPTATIPSVFAKTNGVLALRELVQTCLDSMSTLSRQGNKGLFLTELQASFFKYDNLTEAQVAHKVLELLRGTACYRETWFFQAAYGETRSAQALIQAIRDPKWNKKLPLAAIIFNNPDIDITGLTDDAILKHIRRLREEDVRWQLPASQIKYEEDDEDAVLSPA